ncbi:MAG: DUF6152 family protein [Gammaproteobacteria bacterium]
MSLGLTAPSFGHHAFVTEFDPDQTGTVEGIVTEVLWANPHIRYGVAFEQPAAAELALQAPVDSRQATGTRRQHPCQAMTGLMLAKVNGKKIPASI